MAMSNFRWLVTTREMYMACWASTQRRCQRQACWWRLCFSLQRTHVSSFPSMSRGTSINGLMIWLIPLSLALTHPFGLMYLLFWQISRSFHGYYNIWNEKVIFRRRSWRSQPLLSPQRSDVGHNNVRLVGAYRPQTFLSLRFLWSGQALIVFPTVSLLSGDLVGLCQPLALLGRLGFGPSEGTIHFWIETLNSPANRPGLHKLAPRSQTKEGFCCCGVLSCVCVCFSVGLFSWLADINWYFTSLGTWTSLRKVHTSLGKQKKV